MISNNEELFPREKFKKKLIDTFVFTIDFLNQNNLKWFVGGGTCIGTIRHKGLIPWDDDIDIFMPRDDYQKLVNLHSLLEESNYELVSWYSDNNYPFPYAKIVDKNTTLWEQKNQPCVIGVFIDVFPLDVSDSTLAKNEQELKMYDRYLNLYWSSISDYSFKEMIELLKQKHLRYFCHSILSLFTRRRKKYYLNRLMTLDAKHYCISGDYLVAFSACFAYKYQKEIFKKEWFDDYILMPFENLEVRVPVGYDAYLTHVYGDYMKQPPKEARITRHYHYYLNLEERKTIEEIREIKKTNIL